MTLVYQKYRSQSQLLLKWVNVSCQWIYIIIFITSIMHHRFYRSILVQYDVFYKQMP